jgi:hypothetical protein
MRTELAPYPVGPTGKDATPVAASSGNVAAATASAAITAAANQLAYITGFEFTALGATAGSIVLLTVAGLIGGVTLTYIINVPAGATTSIPNLIVEFPIPIPAAALGGSITVSVPSLGAGNTNACVNAHGFQLPFSS